ncbi:unnamed protein product [Thelazia callipaeda]|uniref:Glutaredoxin domain-containing protein n=1 Tax=Thelazia callipaeda TaxID=103827 RepID=A0A0N5DBA2_THECL|nr:unnamed protein product [Thelazia callipaeda]
MGLLTRKSNIELEGLLLKMKSRCNFKRSKRRRHFGDFEFKVRKQVQKVLMVLDGLGVPFKAIDITIRGNERHRDFMRQNAVNERHDGIPLPPQFFVDEKYLGNYIDFEEAVEDNQLPEFLQLVPSSTVRLIFL